MKAARLPPSCSSLDPPKPVAYLPRPDPPQTHRRFRIRAVLELHSHSPAEEEASAFHRPATVKASCCSSNLHNTAASPRPSLLGPETLARGHGDRAGIGIANHPLVQGLGQFATIWRRGYKEKLLPVQGSCEDAHHEDAGASHKDKIVGC